MRVSKYADKFCVDCFKQITKYGKCERCKSCVRKHHYKDPENRATTSKIFLGRPCNHKDKISKKLKEYWRPIICENNLNKTHKQIYYKAVRRLTSKQPIHLLEHYIKRGRAGSIGGYHLDHKFSIYEGLRQNIPPYVIAHISNLEFIPWQKNTSKIQKCSISKEELFESIFCNNIKTIKEI